jgi:DNA-binding transcriptional regulator YiaG
MTIKEMRTKSKLTQTEFGNILNIPMKSIQNWEIGRSKCPDYVLKLIEYYLVKEKII